ncbi:hypothetical protein Hypma_005522 [Hypsizygus marmoreus]|uniref:Uncharacterized protein n=1 Tax=Hypsizygus marmoreus TaxID=39966 RepID=A0A369JZ70_HYPMA|nr:hypothetical protein Hypma_005522 [Hypsizygus marmoreus]
MVFSLNPLAQPAKVSNLATSSDARIFSSNNNATINRTRSSTISPPFSPRCSTSVHLKFLLEVELELSQQNMHQSFREAHLSPPLSCSPSPLELCTRFATKCFRYKL